MIPIGGGAGAENAAITVTTATAARPSGVAAVPSLTAAAAAAAIAVVVAVALDAALGEPPGRVHPVALFGAAVAPFDRDWKRPDAVGVAVAVALPLAAAVAVGGTVAVAAGVGPRLYGVPPVGVAAAALALWVTVSRRMLVAVAAETVALTETDPEAARERVVALVGRDPSDLSPPDLRSAAVESAAENLADGVVAPLGWFVAGATAGVAAAGVAPLLAASLSPAALALGGGSAAAAWAKAVNTLDSMLGYRSKPVGRASARLDDAVMSLPARASAVCLAVAARSPGSLRDARSLAREPASPNSGWPMATAAVALGVRLEKRGAYVLDGGPEPPTPATARDGVRLVGTAAGVAAAVAVGWLLALAGVTAWS
ncbi:CobD/CbiB family cobalamin biosynthesis protein [Halorubrum tebenquichense]|uniref:Probable cobalamin biosynthesis protein CobD n=1 Tax=Halorubrum tebenquichense DSM 14210 TaxID=1227485 RepID=M0DMQ9_9EURY|nr:CobD/CbiB family cobalamin biosynthesis protein [Halorubrum tebenquichense]ELZ36791.1 cobalamin biosynthesis protein CobD [Halorubrum tebenquichense DSM 14210]